MSCEHQKHFCLILMVTCYSKKTRWHGQNANSVPGNGRQHDCYRAPFIHTVQSMVCPHMLPLLLSLSLSAFFFFGGWVKLFLNVDIIELINCINFHSDLRPTLAVTRVVKEGWLTCVDSFRPCHHISLRLFTHPVT